MAQWVDYLQSKPDDGVQIISLYVRADSGRVPQH